MKNKQILYCILGSMILSLTNNKKLIHIASAGLLWDIVDIVSGIGIILTIIFSVLLIVKNLKHQ